MDWKQLFAKVFTKGAWRTIELLAVGGYITYKVTGAIDSVGKGIDKRIAKSEHKTDSLMTVKERRTNMKFETVLTMLQKQDSTLNKDESNEMKRLRKENWELRKETILNEKKKTLSLIDSNLYRPELTALKGLSNGG